MGLGSGNPTFVPGVEKVDVVSSVLTYVATAISPSASTADAVWKLKRIYTIGSITTTEYANDGEYASVWDNRNSEFTTPSFFNTLSTVFDGVNDRIEFGDVFLYDNATQWSLSMWVRPNNFGSLRALYSKATNDANVFGWGFYIDTSARILAQMRASGQLRSHTGTATLTALAWNHVVFTYDGSQNINGLRIYINGAVDATPSSGTVTNTLLFNQTAMIGSRNGRFNYVGHIDEVSFWNVALSGAQVTTLYNAGSPTDLSLESFVANMDNWYRMGDSDTYPTIFDNVGTDDGTMTNMSSASFEGVTP